MNPDWTEEDTKVLIDNIETMSSKELQRKFFPDRTVKAINRKIEKLRDKGLLGKRDRDTLKRSLYKRRYGD